MQDSFGDRRFRGFGFRIWPSGLLSYLNLSLCLLRWVMLLAYICKVRLRQRTQSWTFFSILWLFDATCPCPLRARCLFSEDPQVCHAHDSLDLVAVGFLFPGCTFCLDYMLSVLLEVFLDFWKLEIRNDYAAIQTWFSQGPHSARELKKCLLGWPQCTETLGVEMESIGVASILPATPPFLWQMLIDVGPSPWDSNSVKPESLWCFW